MTNPESCVFCDGPSLEWRTIRSEDLYFSIVSRPWFRPGHCLVIPTRHITTPAELRDEESVGIMAELGRLSVKLDQGYGSGIMQKHQPLQAENGVKVGHLHFHVFPRQEDEPGLFPVPEPNAFEGFVIPTDAEVSALKDRLW